MLRSIVQDTRERILDTAQKLAQQRGFSAFSYADVSEAVGIRKASIHHHFPSKDDLELALVRRYNERFAQALDDIERRHTGAAKRLRAYGLLYRATLDAGALCLCGMMASDIVALPEPLRAPLGEFFAHQSRWLAALLESGRRSGEFLFSGPPLRRAQTVLATLQGGLLMARGVDDPALFDALLDDLLAGVGHK